MTKLQIYGCGGAPSGGWSGSLDFFVIKFQDAGVAMFFFRTFLRKVEEVFFCLDLKVIFFVYTHEI